MKRCWVSGVKCAGVVGLCIYWQPRLVGWLCVCWPRALCVCVVLLTLFLRFFVVVCDTWGVVVVFAWCRQHAHHACYPFFPS